MIKHFFLYIKHRLVQYRVVVKIYRYCKKNLNPLYRLYIHFESSFIHFISALSPPITIVCDVNEYLSNDYDDLINNYIKVKNNKTEIVLLVKSDTNVTLDQRYNNVFVFEYNNKEKINQFLCSIKSKDILYVTHNSLLDKNIIEEIIRRRIRYKSDIMYFDSIDRDGTKYYQNFKPDLSIDYLRSTNYIGNVLYFKKNIFMSAGEFDLEFSSDYLYDFILKCVDKGYRIDHVQKICFMDTNYKEIMCTNNCGPVEKDADKIIESIRYTKFLKSTNLNSKVSFSVIILNKDKPEYIIPLVKSLIPGVEKSNLEIIVGDTGSTDIKVLDFYKRHSNKIKVVTGLKYHFSKNYNSLVAKYAKGNYLAIFNNDLQLPHLEIFDKVLDAFSDKSIGILGAKLLYKDRSLQHAGVFFFEDGDHKGLPYHRYHGESQLQLTKKDSTTLETVPAVTGAFLFCRKEEFIGVDGFDEKYNEESQDIDLCLKYSRMNRKIVFINYDNIYHWENGTREKGSENFEDRQYFLGKWNNYINEKIIGHDFNCVNKGKI